MLVQIQQQKLLAQQDTNAQLEQLLKLDARLDITNQIPDKVPVMIVQQEVIAMVLIQLQRNLALEVVTVHLIQSIMINTHVQ